MNPMGPLETLEDGYSRIAMELVHVLIEARLNWAQRTEVAEAMFKVRIDYTSRKAENGAISNQSAAPGAISGPAYPEDHPMMRGFGGLKRSTI